MSAIATAQAAPSEQEIRDAIESRRFMEDHLLEAIDEASKPVNEPAWQATAHSEPPDASSEPEDAWNVLWWDLRPTEATRLYELVGEARSRAIARCKAIIVDELTAAGVAFAAEHPDAPRP